MGGGGGTARFAVASATGARREGKIVVASAI